MNVRKVYIHTKPVLSLLNGVQMAELLCTSIIIIIIIVIIIIISIEEMSILKFILRK
jgi:hypothetical protein